MSLGECMAKHTHRQYLVWMAWLEAEWNRPDRTDHYLQLIATETRRSWVSKPNQVKFEHLKLRFGTTEEGAGPSERLDALSQRSPEDIAERRKKAAAVSKATWLGRMTMPIERVEQTKIETHRPTSRE